MCLLSHPIRDTLSSHTALSQRHRVSEKACCNVKRKLTFVEFTQTDQEWRKKKRVRMRRRGGGWKGEKDGFLSWQPVNRLMGVRFAMSWYLSGWAERERQRHTKWHSDGFLTAFFFFSPWPHFVPCNWAFIYLFTSFHDAVNSIHFFANGQVTLHQEQGQPQRDIWWLRGASRWC